MQWPDDNDSFDCCGLVPLIDNVNNGNQMELQMRKACKAGVLFGKNEDDKRLFLTGFFLIMHRYNMDMAIGRHMP